MYDTIEAMPSVEFSERCRAAIYWTIQAMAPTGFWSSTAHLNLYELLPTWSKRLCQPLLRIGYPKHAGQLALAINM